MSALTIRKDQMELFRREEERRMEQRLTRHFLTHYPRESRQAGGPAALLPWVRRGIALARSRGFETERDLGLFTALTLILGAEFDRDPQLPWAAGLLADLSLGPSDRLDYLYRTTLDYLSSTAGEDSELIVRAMLRIRAWDPALAPATDADAWEQDMCALFDHLYPEKFAFQDEDATLAMLRAIPARAARYQLDAPPALSIYALHAFMLGFGFDTDPLHPWAAQALSAPDCPSPQDRVARLWDAAMQHLNESLSKD